MNHFILAAMTVANCLGTLALRQGAAETGPAVTVWAITGAGLYVAGAGLYLQLLTTAPLGALATATCILSIIVMIAAGVVFHGETYSGVQVAGLVLGLAAVGLILARR